MTTPIAASNIAAQAFEFLELDPISSFDEASAQATDATQKYPTALSISLEMTDWSFASHLVTLPEAAAPADLTADENLPNLYTLPADCVRLLEVRPRNVRWRLDQTYLRADQATSIDIRYTRLVTAEAQLPATFQTAVAYQLALLMAPRWLQSRSKMADLKSNAKDAMDLAERSDAPMASRNRLDDREPSYSNDWYDQVMR